MAAERHFAQIKHDRLQAELVVIMAEHRAIVPRGYETARQRAALHREWDEKYDELIALRLWAYEHSIELPQLFPATTVLPAAPETHTS